MFDVNVMKQGLTIMGFGLAGVFVTLILFYFIIVIFNKTIKDKNNIEDK
jgi:Na+-transporting methylmalonyl-CoA/oxaloacetate decarboxylase gamma subunit